MENSDTVSDGIQLVTVNAESTPKKNLEETSIQLLHDQQQTAGDDSSLEENNPCGIGGSSHQNGDSHVRRNAI